MGALLGAIFGSHIWEPHLGAMMATMMTRMWPSNMAPNIAPLQQSAMWLSNMTPIIAPLQQPAI